MRVSPRGGNLRGRGLHREGVLSWPRLPLLTRMIRGRSRVGTIFAEAQRRYFESVAPYARRLIQQGHTPKVDQITGLPPAVALQQRRGTPSSRSTVGTVTTLSNSMRMLFSRAGTYPPTAVGRLASDSFSPNTAVGACLLCHGLGTTHTVSESSLVPDASLSIRDGAIAAWPGAWQGKNLRDVLVALGHDVDTPWRDLPHASRDWILFTEEQPVVQVTPLRDRIEKPYQGRFWSAKSYVMHTLADVPASVTRRFLFQDLAPVIPERTLREAQRIKLATELQRAGRGTRSTCSTSRPRGCTPRTCSCC